MSTDFSSKGDLYSSFRLIADLLLRIVVSKCRIRKFYANPTDNAILMMTQLTITAKKREGS